MTAHDETQLHDETKRIHSGYAPGNKDPRQVPIVQSTTYTFDSSDGIAAAFKPNTKALFGEIIANPAMSVFDVEKFARVDHGQGVPLIVDAGTFDYASGTFPRIHRARRVLPRCRLHQGLRGGAVRDLGVLTGEVS